MVFVNNPIEYKNSVATSVQQIDNDNFAYMWRAAVIRQHTNDLHVCIIHFCGRIAVVWLHHAPNTHTMHILEALVTGWPRVAYQKKKRRKLISAAVSFLGFLFSPFVLRVGAASPPTTLLPNATLEPIAAVADVCCCYCCCCIVQCLVGSSVMP